jgi:hypothetical protein
MTTRTLLRRIHLVAGLVGFVIIFIFWTSTVSVELFGSHEAIADVKRAIRWGLILLVPALAITGLTGFRMAGQSTNPRVLAKKRRMPFIAGLGLIILVPAALYLAATVDDGLGTSFYLAQALELLAGATNLTLMALNIRDGLRLTGRLGSAMRPTA